MSNSKRKCFDLLFFLLTEKLLRYKSHGCLLVIISLFPSADGDAAGNSFASFYFPGLDIHLEGSWCWISHIPKYKCFDLIHNTRLIGTFFRITIRFPTSIIIPTYLPTYIHTYIHIYIHTYIHTYYFAITFHFMNINYQWVLLIDFFFYLFFLIFGQSCLGQFVRYVYVIFMKCRLTYGHDVCVISSTSRLER